MRKLFPTYIFRCMDTATIYDVIEVKGPVLDSTYIWTDASIDTNSTAVVRINNLVVN